MQFETAQGPIAVNIADIAQMQQEILKKLHKNQSFALATINLDHLVKLDTNPTFHRAYQDQDMIVADGNPIVWMSRIAGEEVDLLPGSDMVEPLCAQMAELGFPIALVGGVPEALDAAEVRLRKQLPNLKIALKLSPPFGFDPESPAADDVLRAVQESGARLCFLAFGAPKQEILAARGKTIATETGFVSVGAGLDFLAGFQERAPLWVRKIAMEWLWRLAENPRRMAGRYARCFAILPKHTFRAFLSRFSTT